METLWREKLQPERSRDKSLLGAEKELWLKKEPLEVAWEDAGNEDSRWEVIEMNEM